jgi:predicted metal-dependent hydrolase
LNLQKLQFDLFDDRYDVIERVSAKARNVRIEIRSPREVQLIIPRYVSKTAARAFLQQRESWVRQKITELRQRLGDTPLDSQRLRWDGDDRIPLRGVEMPIAVAPASVRSVNVRLEPQAITLFCPSAQLGDSAKLEQALRKMLQHQARLDAERLLDEEAQRLGLRYGGLRIADQRSLWGSCAVGGNISLSWRLVMAPPTVFRYVVIHELCHLRHHDHSDAFWALVEQQMPEFEIHRRWLKENGQRLHLYLAPRGA